MKIVIKNIAELIQTEDTPRKWVSGSDMKSVSTIKDAFVEIEDGIITDFGSMDQWKGVEDWNNTEIIDAEGKENALVSLAKKEGFSLRQVVAVGDGANDIKMLARAGLGIAFNAKPIVQRQAQASINLHDLKLILYFLGINGLDLQELSKVVGKSTTQSWPKKK